jgi:hypothetical protein
MSALDIVGWCGVCGSSVHETRRIPGASTTCRLEHLDPALIEPDEAITLRLQYSIAQAVQRKGDFTPVKEIWHDAGVLRATRSRLRKATGIVDEIESSVDHNVVYHLYERSGAEIGRRFLFSIEKGGVTGCESFYIDGYVMREIVKELSEDGREDSWCACAGTVGRWDRLEVHGVKQRILSCMERLNMVEELMVS